MLRIAWRQIANRRGRSLAVALAIIVAGTGFTVLTASSDVSRLHTTSIVRANARSVYDILIRPKATRSRLERSRSLIQPGFLTGIYGGITIGQWHRVQALSGIAVAAPIAMLGYVFPSLEVPVNLKGVWSRRGDSVARIDVAWTWDNGLTRIPQVPDFSFITSKPLRFNLDAPADAGEWVIDGTTRDICRSPLAEDFRPESRPSQLVCFSRTAGGESTIGEYRIRNARGYLLHFALPYVVAAVDPASENALVGLDSSASQGSGLEGKTTRYLPSITGEGLPVLIADRVGIRETAQVTLSRLGPGASTAVLAGEPTQRLKDFGPSGKRTQLSITAQQANDLLLQQFHTAKPARYMRNTRFLPGEVRELGEVSLPTVNLREAPPTVRVIPGRRPTTTELLNDVQYDAPGSGEPATRHIVTSTQEQDSTFGESPLPQTLYLAGTFSARKLRGLDDVTARILGGYGAAPTVGADARSRELLHGKSLRPSGYLGGFVQPPPTMITTLKAASLLTSGWTKGNYLAPISAIRVRVAGVTGVDALSRERVRLAAERIHAATGLQVDIATGSSATREELRLPAGAHGRPELDLEQWWVKKGVAQAILKALDKKSVVLFILVLLISALSVANAAVSSVRSRRRELGVLACLGWRRQHLFRSVITEIVLIAVGAGVASTALSLVLAHVVGTPVSISRAALAVPAALAVASAAGVVPAWLASRSSPIDAVRSAASAPTKAHNPRTIRKLATIGVSRVKSRTILAALGLSIAVLVFTVLLAITLAFQGAVVGTILGDAVAIQARAVDYAATGASLALAFIGVANVLYLNIRDRGPELATLRAVGWSDRHLDRLIVSEGTLIGLLGATPGALAGVLIAMALTGTVAIPYIVGAMIAWGAALCLSAIAAGMAARLVRRLPTTLLLTE